MQLFFLCWLSELSLEVLWLLKRMDDTEFPGLEEGSYNRCQFDVSEIARFFFFFFFFTTIATWEAHPSACISKREFHLSIKVPFYFFSKKKLSPFIFI